MAPDSPAGSRQGKIMSRNFDLYADPYIVAMKRYERLVLGYGAIAIIALVASFIVSSGSEAATGMFAPLVANVKFTVGAGLLAGSCVASLVAAWAIGRRIYFAYWPERFY